MRSIRRIRGRPTSVRGPVVTQDELDEPILAELFSIERLEQHGATLAAAQTISHDPRRAYALRSRVTENGRVLLASYRALARAIKDERAITPAAEWLVDNFHIVDEQLREIRDDLPADYYRELPKLAEGHLQGYPRVVGLAWAYVAHTDSRFDAESLHRFVDAYQRVEPLTIGELWAVAISLRIVLVENLRRLAESIVRGRDSRQKANELADGLLGLGSDRPELTASSLLRLADTALSTPGQVQLFQRLRDQDPAVTPALGWLEELVAARGTSAEEIVRLEHQRQAAMNVTVRNVITSMRLISWFDWAEFVEGLSLVDRVLRDGSSFGSMDFATRDRYRHAIEKLARRSGRSEVEVARTAILLAAAPGTADDAGRAGQAGQAGAGGMQAPLGVREGTQEESAAPASGTTWDVDDSQATPTGRRRDAGRHLISDGRPSLEQALECRVPWTERLRRAFSRMATCRLSRSITRSPRAAVVQRRELSGLVEGEFASPVKGGAQAPGHLLRHVLVPSISTCHPAQTVLDTDALVRTARLGNRLVQSWGNHTDSVKSARVCALMFGPAVARPARSHGRCSRVSDAMVHTSVPDHQRPEHSASVLAPNTRTAPHLRHRRTRPWSHRAPLGRDHR